MTKLEKLEAEKWRLAQAMDDAPNISTSAMVMMELLHVTREIYYEEMRLTGVSRAKAKKELFSILDNSTVPYADSIRGIL